MKTGNDNFFEASQFVVVNGSGLEIRLEDSNLEIWVNSKKEIGLAKHYPIGKSGKGKYLSKAFEVGKVVLAGANLVASLVSQAYEFTMKMIENLIELSAFLK